MIILVVDDNQTNRKLQRVTLNAEGFTVLEAADGVEALAVLERQPVDAVISDILMPRMDGFRLCQEVRKHPRFGHLPFVIFTGTYKSPKDERLALDVGADRYLRKPCPVAAMVAALQEAAAEAEAQQRRPQRPAQPQELTVMREYSEALVRKLEQTKDELARHNAQLEAANEALSASRAAALNVMEDAVEARKQAEQTAVELRDSENRYRALFNGMTEGFALSEILCDEKGAPCDCRLLEINPAFEFLTGLKREDVIGKTLRQVLPDDNPRWVSTFGEVALTGKSIHFDDYSPTLRRHYDIFAYCPAPRQFAVLFMDITGRKELEDRLKWLARFPEENVHPVLRVAADGRLLYANPASQPLLETWKTAVGGSVPELWVKRVDAALNHRTRHTAEVELNGRFYSITVVPIPEAGYANLYGLDITDLREAQKRELEALAAATASQAAREAVSVMNVGVALINLRGQVISVNPVFEALTGRRGPDIVGQDAAAVMSGMVKPGDRPSLLAMLDRAGRGVGSEPVYVTLLSGDGSGASAIMDVSHIRNPAGQPATIVVTLKDITDLRKAEWRSQAITTLLALFVRKSSRKDYLDAVVKVIRQWSGCRCVGIRIADSRGNIPYEASVGFPPDFVESEGALCLDQDHCVCTRVMLGAPEPQDRPCVTPAASFRCDNTIRFLKSLPDEAKARFRGVCMRRGFASVAVVPIRYHDRIHGAIHLADEREGTVSAERVEFIESILAPLMGEAVHRFDMQTALETYQNQLRATTSRLSLTEERSRRELAVALHDTVGQTLALSKIKLGSLSELLTDKKAAKALTDIRDMFDEAVRQTRTLSFELSPPILYELGLDAAIEWLGEEFQRRHGFRFHFEGMGDGNTLGESVNILLFHSVRELLTNVVKHAAATHVQVSSRMNHTHAVVTVRDDGRGFSVRDRLQSGNNKSLGLFSVRERMKDIGGTFEIESVPGQGTTVTLSVPTETKASP